MTVIFACILLYIRASWILDLVIGFVVDFVGVRGGLGVLRGDELCGFCCGVGSHGDEDFGLVFCKFQKVEKYMKKAWEKSIELYENKSKLRHGDTSFIKSSFSISSYLSHVMDN